MPIISIPNSPKATGGDVKTIHLSGTNYVMHVFEDSGFFVVPTDITSCTVVVVGGGGSGGASYGDNDTGEGGGGAGGLLFRDNFTISAGTYECGIGRGGYHIMQKGHGTTGSYGGSFGWSGSGENGNDSCLNKSTAGGATLDVIARGGGGGGSSDMHGGSLNGGSGGGGGARNSTASYNYGQGSNQPTFSSWTHRGSSGGNSTNGNHSGAGGGGAGANGSDHIGAANYGTGGDGGIGYDYSSYFGTLVGDRGWFAGGGGGGTYRKSDLPAVGTAYTDYLGIGGKGGGGNGIFAEEHSDGNTFKHQKMDGMRGTGGGGGGSGEDAVSRVSIGGNARTGCKVGTGGSGVVIIRYAQ